MKQFRFLEWQVYGDAQELCSEIFVLVNKLPAHHRFTIGDQLRRSCTSVILNIAEGSGKTSDRELNRFLEIALGSLYETLAGIDMLKRNNLVTFEDFQDLQIKIGLICDQLGGFKKSIGTRGAVVSSKL